jgi:hypothetical protein
VAVSVTWLKSTRCSNRYALTKAQYESVLFPATQQYIGYRYTCSINSHKSIVDAPINMFTSTVDDGRVPSMYSAWHHTSVYDRICIQWWRTLGMRVYCSAVATALAASLSASSAFAICFIQTHDRSTHITHHALLRSYAYAVRQWAHDCTHKGL